MMPPIADWETPAEGVFSWHGFNPDCRTDCWSTALRTPEGLVLIDPLPLAEPALARLADKGRVVAVLLTNGNHERAAADVRERFGVPTYAPEGAQDEVTADHWVREGDVLFQSLRAIALPGGGAGETAYLAPGGLVVGDALIHLKSLELLPEKYCRNPQKLRQSLQALLSPDYETVCFAHGPPLRVGARARIKQLLSSCAL